jgi:hypothetical protein
MVTIARLPQEAHCPQASHGRAVRSRMPYGTIKCFRKDIQRGILVPIQDEATACTDVGSYTQGLFDQGPTRRTPLTGELGRDGDHGDVMHHAVGFDPVEEDTPSGIVNGFRQVMVLDHVANLKVLISNHIARCDERVCLLAGKIFTLPLDLEIRFRQPLAGPQAVLAAFLLAGKVAMKPLQLLFGFAKVARILDSRALRIGVVGFQADINADLLACRDVLYPSLRLDAELDVVAVSTADQTNPLDLLAREGFDVLLRIADQPQSSNATPIGEANVLAIVIQLPACRFVLHAAIILLEPGKAFLAGLVLLARVIEALDSKPGAVGTGLTGLGVETSGKRVRFSQVRTRALHIVLADATLIHPLAQTLVPDELNGTNSFLNASILPLRAIHLVLVDQHLLAFLLRLCYTQYTSIAGIYQEEHSHETNQCLSFGQAIRAASGTC